MPTARPRAAALAAFALAPLLAPAGPGPAAGPEPARLHAGAGAYLEVTVEDRAVRIELVGEQETIGRWMRFAYPFTAGEGDRIPADREARLLDAWHRFLRDRAPFRIGGRTVVPPGDDGAKSADVVPAVTAVRIPEDSTFNVPVVAFSAAVTGLDRAPSSIDFAWRDWTGLEDERGATLLAILFKVGFRVSFGQATPDEPGYTWRPRDPAQLTEGLGATVPDQEPSPEPWRWPAAGIAAVLLGLGVGALRLRAGPVHAGTPALAGALLGTALWATGIGVVETAPLWRTRPGVPSAEHQRRIFEDLHRTIYDAFTQGTEQEVYARLAASVTPRLLDQLFGDIYESLILRDENGAISRVETYEVLDAQPGAQPLTVGRDGGRSGEDAPRFALGWHWRIHGLVEHWGHQHRRINEYRATYELLHDGVSWKIDDYVVHGAERIDRGGAASRGR